MSILTNTMKNYSWTHLQQKRKKKNQKIASLVNDLSIFINDRKKKKKKMSKKIAMKTLIND